jgi:DNA-binding response OmpR family regulator
MATATLAATLNSPIPELRPATMDRILVIENDEALRKILRRSFSAEGYEVDVVREPFGALGMVHQKMPSAVVLDLEHPESSGCDLCKKITHLLPGLPTFNS